MPTHLAAGDDETGKCDAGHFDTMIIDHVRWAEKRGGGWIGVWRSHGFAPKDAPTNT
jgi:hypothetical protein